MLLLIAAGPFPLILAAGAAVAIPGGRHLYRTHSTELVLLAWTITIFSQAVASQFGRNTPMSDLVKMADEPLMLLLLAWTLLERRRPSARWLLLVPAIGFLAAGFASNILQSTPVAPAVVGGWSGIKIWILLFITTSLPWRQRDLAVASRWIAVVVSAVLAVAVMELVAPSLHRAWLPVQAAGSELRGGRVGLQSVFTHPDHFGSFASVFGAYFLARFVSTGNRRHLALGLACVTLGLLSLRLKVILGLVAALSVLSLSATGKFVRRLGVVVLFGVFVVATTGGILADLTTQQLDRYVFGENVTVRQELYTVGQQIALDNFPFGAGLGRFGSGASTTFNSPVYEEYEITRRGLTQESPGVRHDTTWPTVMGEAGVLGMMFFLGGLAFIGFRLFASSRTSDPVLSEFSLAGLAVLVAVIVESVARPSFFNAITAFSIALLVGAPLELGSRWRMLSSPWLASPNRQPSRLPQHIGAEPSKER